ncbi:MAG TPA: 2-dehydropantoate 2-reductase [Chloroflexota bacterium]|jgi:2-dehydropantoate 2-reductase|nr:2-dehydropantoate 2-reductase [Chloroflexota bacterium]
MRIAVIGAGAIGGLYGGLLARAGQEVQFLARGAHLASLTGRGLEVRTADLGTFHVDAVAAADPRELAPAELAVLTVKTYDLEAALPATAQLLAPGGSVLTLQNGLDAPDQVARKIPSELVLIGTTAVETTLVEPGVIAHMSPFRQVTVAAFDGPPTPVVRQVVEVLRGARIDATSVEDGHRSLWEKAAPLIPLATLTSLCQLPIGPIRELPETRALIETLLAEVIVVARAYGYDLSDVQQRSLTLLDRIPPTMRASMARDFERGGRTELEALTGAIVRLAESRQVEVPATRAAYAVLKLREQQLAQARDGVGSVVAGQ